MYTRHTELRKLRERDEYNLALKLDEDGVRRLMEKIPQHLNAQQCSNAGTLDWQRMSKDGRKYSNSDFESIKNAFHASGGTRLLSQIFLDEWKTSGRKEERPTLGVLLQLLIVADCWKAADFLAKELLQESSPQRPLKGPAKLLKSPIKDIGDNMEEYLNDIPSYATTGELVNGLKSINNNLDYRTKFMFEKAVPSDKTNERDKFEEGVAETLVNGHTPTNVNNSITTNTQNNEGVGSSTLQSSGNIPLISILMKRGENNTPSASGVSESQSSSSTTEISTNDSTATATTTTTTTTTEQISTDLNAAPIPNISILMSTDRDAEDEQVESMNASVQIRNEVLPQLRELHIDCEQREQQQRQHEEVITGGSSTSSSNSNSSMSNNDDEINNENDLEYNVPNLSLFEQNSSNNDSSLTSVTGTSGENSFDEQDNLPCLSALEQ